MGQTFLDVVNKRLELNKKIDEMYLDTIKQINMRLEQIGGSQNFQREFLNACAMDISGEVVRNFFDMSDYNLTVDQLAVRILEFDYKNEYDPLGEIENNKKNLYNLENSQESKMILHEELGDPEKLFEKQEITSNGKIRKEYKDKNMIEKGKKDYREQKKMEDDYHDETGTAQEETLEVDHIQPLASAQMYTRYTDDDGVKKVKEFYNSDDNFAMLGKTANQCKGDARVYDSNGNDITYKATPEQMTDAIVKKLEGGKNRKPETTQKLKDDGILDENGKVKPEVKRKIKEQVKNSQNKESEVILKNTNYGKVGKDAVKDTGKQFCKIFAGQIIYYVVPPLIYEIKQGMENSSETESIFERLSVSTDRVIDYVLSKKDKIIENLSINSLKKFLKNFFTIIIELVKATVKKILKIAKQLVVTGIDAVKILLDSSKTWAEKMDALMQLISGLIVVIVCDLLFEYIGKQFLIPEMFLQPLQMVVTIIVSNFVMLSLKKLNIFNNNKFNIEKVEQIFQEEQRLFYQKAHLMLKQQEKENKVIIEALNNEIYEICTLMKIKDFYIESVKNDISRLSEIFNKKIDFNQEIDMFFATEK